MDQHILEVAVDQHVIDYYEWLEALDWQAACEQQRIAEGIWEDNGHSWPTD